LFPLCRKRSGILSSLRIKRGSRQPHPIVIVSPHPDDETLATGGLIAWATERGIDVQIPAVTDGENAYRDSVGLGSVRQREQEQALNALGVESDHILRLHITDSDISSHVDQLSDGLSSLCTAETQVLAPWPHDFHSGS
jgi:LmbE family N-acetylglucosaminyl deacetylase